jgi:hypothetical protein
LENKLKTLVDNKVNEGYVFVPYIIKPVSTSINSKTVWYSNKIKNLILKIKHIFIKSKGIESLNYIKNKKINTSFYQTINTNMKYKLKRYTDEIITELKPNEVFVFGSNVDGYHGAGAAKIALQFGAVIGEGYGYYGNTYAIATKDLRKKGLKTVSLKHMKEQILEFRNFARTKPELTFLVTKIGTGLAGFTNKEIADIFDSIYLPVNIVLPKDFVDLFEND